MPTIDEPKRLQLALDEWEAAYVGRPLCVCDERGGAASLGRIAFEQSPGVLIGPEGGFSAVEFESLQVMKHNRMNRLACAWLPLTCLCAYTLRLLSGAVRSIVPLFSSSASDHTSFGQRRRHSLHLQF